VEANIVHGELIVSVTPDEAVLLYDAVHEYRGFMEEAQDKEISQGITDEQHGLALEKNVQTLRSMESKLSAFTDLLIPEEEEGE
jgi:hypothetical protein